MRKVLHTLGQLFVMVVLGFSLTACGGQSNPEPSPTPEPTIAQPKPDNGPECITSTITVEYKNSGIVESFKADLHRHDVLENRYSTSINRFDDDGNLTESISLVVYFYEGGTFSGSGSKTYFPLVVNSEFIVTDVTKHSTRC